MPSSPALSTPSSGDDYLGDDWSLMPDGSRWDGRNLLDLVSKGQSPFSPIWDVNLLLQEVEDKAGAKVIDAPRVHTGSNNYGFHLKLSDQRDVLARLKNADVNMPRYDGFSLHWLHQQLNFEVATYTLLQNTPGVPTDRLLHHRPPLQHSGAKHGMPKDISGRRLMIFETAQGECRLWAEINQQQRMSTLADAAKIRAELMNLELPSQFVSDWLLWRTLQPVEWMPKELPLPISATRDFWLATFEAKVETMIKNEGDIIGWPEDNETTSITSLFDWETGCVVPVVLSKIVFFIAGGDLTIDENGEPSVYIRPGWSPKPEELAKNQGYSAEFLKEINRHAPYLEEAIHKAKDARHLWVKLKKWKGQDPEKFFGELGDWAEK